MGRAPASTEIPKENAPIDSRVTVRLDKLGQGIEHLTTSFKAVKETNSLIVIVLFVGFLGLLFALGLAGIGAVNSDITSRDQLKDSVQQLNQKLDILKPTTNSNTLAGSSKTTAP